jgi:hypothetical protein
LDLDEILYGTGGIENYLHYILFNPMASIIPKWWTYKLLRCVLLLNQLVFFHETLHISVDVEDDIGPSLLNLAD